MRTLATILGATALTAAGWLTIAVFLVEQAGHTLEHLGSHE